MTLLKKTQEILPSKNNNRTKIVTTRVQCVTTHKMHIYRESNNNHIQSKGKTQRDSTRMYLAKVEQSCSVQKGVNPSKRKVSDTGKMKFVNNQIHRVNAATNM